MTPQKQLSRHLPHEGIIGDCWRTTIACLLDLQPCQVPHFCDGERWNDTIAANSATRTWLRRRGLDFIEYAMAGDLTDVLRSVGACNPSLYYLLGGTSRTGVNHSVICRDDCIVWDPSITDAGIVGPMDDGYYWITWLVPALLLGNRHDTAACAIFRGGRCTCDAQDLTTTPPPDHSPAGSRT